VDRTDAAAEIDRSEPVGPSALRISAADVARIVAHCGSSYPDEACGMIAGTGGEAAVVYCLTNADASPASYRIDSREQFEAMRNAEARGLDVIGCFHSHTRSEAFPSETDVRQAFYPDWAYLLVSLAEENPVLRVFRIQDSRIDEIPLLVDPE